MDSSFVAKEAIWAQLRFEVPNKDAAIM